MQQVVNTPSLGPIYRSITMFSRLTQCVTNLETLDILKKAKTLEGLVILDPYSQVVTTISFILMIFKNVFPAKISLLSSWYKCKYDLAKWMPTRHIKFNMSTTELLPHLTCPFIFYTSASNTLFNLSQYKPRNHNSPLSSLLQ